MWYKLVIGGMGERERKRERKRERERVRERGVGGRDRGRERKRLNMTRVSVQHNHLPPLQVAIEFRKKCSANGLNEQILNLPCLASNVLGKSPGYVTPLCLN